MVTKVLGAVAILIAVAGCTTTRGSFCTVANQIRPTEKEIAALSDKTVEQILSHLSKGERLCGWRP